MVQLLSQVTSPREIFPARVIGISFRNVSQDQSPRCDITVIPALLAAHPTAASHQSGEEAGY
jgi:hypothetical protein